MSNPYDATSTPSSDNKRPRKLQYWRSYSYVFEQADWLANLLLCSVCFLIPVIGRLVLMGYQYKIIEELHKQPDQKLPKFDFGQFSELLSRGVVPFVVSLILQIVAVPIFLVISILPAICAGIFDDKGAVILAILLMIVLAFMLSVGLSLLFGPLLLRAGLSQSFRETFNLGWIIHFIRMMWIDEIMSTMFMAFSATVLVVIGMLFCFVGVYPAVALSMLAVAHQTYQQYEIFLARGGEPIPLKTPPTAPLATLR